MSLAAGQQFAGYEIIAEIGRGGMGAVYQARQISLQRPVALKILPPHMAGDAGYLARFQAEAVAAASLNHPNIVQVFAAGQSEGIEYIAMEYVEGETIQHRLRRCGRLPLTEALDVAYHVGSALEYAWQSAQLIHRDVKPDNIFLAQNGAVKLGDFGLAKFLREGASSVTLTGHVMGSPHFISPEQARGLRDVDFRADLYSLGCTLHCLMTGRTVFEGPDFVSIVLKQVNDVPAPITTLLPDCPASINRLLARLLEKDREKRPQSYAELLELIVHARTDAAAWEAGDAPARRRLARDTTKPGGSRWAYALAMLLSLAAAGGYVYGKWTEHHHSAARVVTLADPSDRRDFIQALAKLSPLDRFERVMAKMREVNPEMRGKENFTVEEGEISELTFSSVGVRNLWPLCALDELRVIHCPGNATNRQRGDLVDLTPLAELPLEEVDCSWTSIEDLRPLAQLPLKILRCANTRVADLAPLQGLALTELDIASTLVRDVSVLKGMPLASLRCDLAPLHDLEPLRNAPLKTLWGDPRLLRPELVRSWERIETINDLPRLDFEKRRLRSLK